MSTVGERLKQALKMRGMKQKELAARINITQVTLSQYVTGVYSPGYRVIRDAAAVLRVREEWLRTGNGAMVDETAESAATAVANEYNLSKSATTLLNAFASLFVDLPEEEAAQLLNRLKMALNGNPDIAAVHAEILSKIDVDEDVTENPAK